MSTKRADGPSIGMIDYADPRSLGSRLRAKRIGPLLQLIRDAHARYGNVRLLDVGGRKTYWNIAPEGFLQRHQVQVTLLNIASDTDDVDDRIFTQVTGDACSMTGFADRSFHICHSNSVIEHVGGWQYARRFASECRRIASGLFVQSPYFWFPIEPHYVFPMFNWFPRPVQERLVQWLALGHSGQKAPDAETAMAWIDDAPRLLDRRAYRLLFPDCEILTERFMFLPKSLIALRPIA
jgi:hypothetical protein